jgi:hypothetical protein
MGTSLDPKLLKFLNETDHLYHPFEHSRPNDVVILFHWISDANLSNQGQA